MHRRLAAVMATLGAALGSDLRQRRQPRRIAAHHRALRQADSHIAIVNLSRNFGKEIATTAGLDHAQRRRSDRDRRRPAGPARGDPAISSQPGAPATTWSMPDAARARARLAEEGHRRGVLPADAAPGRRAAAGERRRLPADEPPRGRRGAAAARAPSLHEGPVRLGRLSQHGGRLRPRRRAAPAAPSGRSGNCGTWRSRASPASPSRR